MTASTLRPLEPQLFRSGERPSWRPSWRLSTRLTLAFGLVLGLLLVITAVALHRMQRIDVHTTQMIEINQSRIAVMNTMKNAVNELTVAMLGVTLVVDETDAHDESKRIAQGVENYRRARAQLEKLAPAAEVLATATADETSAVAPVAPPDASQASLTIGAAVHVNGDSLAALDEVAQRGLDRADYVRDALLSGSSNLANTLRARSPRPLQEEWLGALRQQGEREAQAAAALHRAVQVEFALARLWLLSVACVAIVLSVVAGTLILRSVTQPLTQAIDHAQRIAQGDLTGGITAQRSDEAGDLLAALAQMQEQLRALVGSIHNSASGIGVASREIAQGNQDLSNRTEKTASELQSTATSMGELAYMVRTSANAASQADMLARQAASAADQGGQAVASVVVVMDEILIGARRISDIVAVIDSIAFQTNILALNAAVEAAHAGEQGRGFAVVATEVRSLAQRVVTAANDIKQLIESALASAGSGTHLARHAGATMQNIVTSAQSVAATISEVASASGAQSHGIQEVSAAVARLDDMTQRNAALVEESAAAAQALEHQAAQLEAVIGVFRVGTQRRIGLGVI